ncbi:MAG: 50S ribosomal protein L18 [Bacteroidales bacterium]
MSNKNSQSRRRIRQSIRNKISGTAEKPRLAVFRSLKNITGQIINDDEGVTMAAIATNTKAFAEEKGNKSELASKAGEKLAKDAIEKGITQVVFDRGGYKYHGRVKAFAEGARKGGLKF